MCKGWTLGEDDSPSLQIPDSPRTIVVSTFLKAEVLMQTTTPTRETFFFCFLIIYLFSLFIFGYTWSLLLPGLFSSCGEWGDSSCCARASHCDGFSCCGAQALGHMDFCSCGSQALEHRLNSCGTRA